MTKIQDVYEVLCQLAPPELQTSFDNAGFLVGHVDRKVDTVLLALDITDEVADEAKALGAQLIVSHHPVIFHPLKSVTAEGEGALVLKLIEAGIGAICMHTNLDIAAGGVNDVLLSLLGAEEAGALDADGCGRIGTLRQDMPLSAFLSICKERLQVNALRYVDGGRGVRKLAVMGGSGGSALRDAIEKGCDTYVTSDIKYHQFLEAKQLGINLIDADHFCTENPVVPILAEKLQQAFPELRIAISKRHHQTVSVF